MKQSAASMLHSRLPRLGRARRAGPLVLAVFAAALGIVPGKTEAAAPRPLFKAAANGQPDTLEVFVIYVQFAPEPEANDAASTTGRGTFGSDKKETSTLDPGSESIRLTPDYLLKHFDFARDYFNRVSNGKVVIVPRLFPKIVDGKIQPVNLDGTLKSYNPALEDKSAKQKTRDFEETRAVQLMSFVSETAEKARADSATDPFRIARTEPASLHKKRAFLLFHAGHSRLVDGGSLGYLGANTPNDFTDFFVTQDDFKWLAKAKTTGSNTSYVNARKKDSLGVVAATGDTIKQFMMLSESASQDGINWGINGILINQLGRQMGMPDLFDVVQGISQVGSFDVMDFAGYNTMNGFLPVFPSAWVRAYMGWDDPVIAKPGTGPFSEYSLYAADQPGTGRTRTLRIPLNDREYLLVENRQRAPRDSNVTIYFSKRTGIEPEFNFPDSAKVRYTALDSVFLDSVCVSFTTNGACKSDGKIPNPNKPSGVITRVSNYDVGIPGNGLLVWHVNEWWIEGSLSLGAINYYAGDQLRSQYKGLELVEADGVPSIGKQFTDPLGQPAFDYGTARDMLPNVFRKRVNPPKDTSWALPDTLNVIGSYGFANTNTWNDGRTHIQLQARVPASPVFVKGVSSFSGDSVFTLRDSAITLRVIWPDNNTVKQPTGSEWPVRTAAAGHPHSVNVLRDGSGRRFVVSAADTGWLQTYTAGGKLALVARDSVRDTNHYAGVETFLSSGNARPVNAAAVNSLVNPAGAPLGAAVVSDSILVVLTGNTVRFVRARADSLNGNSRNGGRDTAIAVKGKIGPLAWGGRVFVIDSTGRLHSFNPAGGAHDSVLLPAANYQSMAGIKVGAANRVIAAGRTTGATPLQGVATLIDPAALTATALDLQWGDGFASDSESFSISVSDFDRAGGDDAFILGSRGSALLFEVQTHPGQAFLGWPQHLTRSALVTDSVKSFGSDSRDSLVYWVTEDRSAPALTDLDRDGHPDIVFSGVNAVHAIDWRGAALPGWPFRPQPRQDVGFTYSNRTLYAGTIGSSPVALTLRGKRAVLVASPDGLIYALDSAGKKQTYTSFDPTQKKGTGVLMSDLSDWPLSVGGLSLDSSRSPYVNLAIGALDSNSGARSLIAQTAAGSLNVWSLPGVAADPADWSLPGGDAGRSSRLDADALGAVVVPGAAESIEEFHLFPSPLRGGLATVHLKLGSSATRARIRVFDLSGRMVKDETLTGLNAGLQPYNRILDLRNLGADVYSVSCEVSFPGGKKTQWQRLGVVK
jgi:M6 family metalloprotease-like protein